MKKIIITIASLFMAGTLYAQVGQVVPASTLRQAIESFVLQKTGLPKEKVFIEYKHSLSDEQAPSGELDLQIKGAQTLKYSGFTPLEVNMVLDNRLYKNFMVYITIDIKTKAYMAARWIKRYEPLTSENITPIETYRSKMPPDAVLEDQDLTGMVAKVGLPRGKIISQTVIVVPPLIKNKDVVDVFLEKGNMKLAVKGMALMDAKAGEAIKVRNLDSKKEIYGKVIDEKTVLVELQ